MEHLVRQIFRSGGYVFAKKAEEIAREHGIPRIARLASNENPRSPSPLAVERAYEAVKEANRYPDEKMTSLVSMLRAYHGDFRFVTGVGMDGVIETVIRTLVDPGDSVAISTPTFSFYGLAAKAQGARVIPVPRQKDFSVDPSALIAAGRDAKITFLCTPNNPTGTVTPVDEIREVLAGISGVLFLDNAYVEFCDEAYPPLMKEFDNLIIGRTMSKAFSLAGLRVGYAFVPDWLAGYYLRAATPFTLNSVSAAAAEGALADPSHVSRTVDHVRQWRRRYIQECRFPVAPSGSNFVMVDVSPRSGDEMTGLLASRGVIVRSCTSFPGLPDHYIRVSIGEDWENELFLSVMNGL